MSVPNFSSLAGIEVAEKFLVVGGGGEDWGGWVMAGQAYPPSILPSLHPKYG